MQIRWTFDERIENHVTQQGWFSERPAKSVKRWAIRATAILIAGIIGVVAGFNLPSNGLLLLGAAGVAAAVIMFIVARSMPSVTMAGAMVRAMLAAYRRTLEKTMAQARSMQQVVEEARLPWLETPDQAVVWGVALGLQGQVENVLQRTMQDVRAGSATGGYLPIWYHGGGDGSDGGGFGGGSGLFSSSALPDFGGMMSALGTIGNSPSSSGSGGGFGGGGSGGGGGGSGGGF